MSGSASGRQRRDGGWMQRLARKRWLCSVCLAVGCAAVGMAISLAKWPLPRVHDEFSYLLAADTFARGRMTNPTHPMWQHLESFHIIFEPTYASKYPPGQGLALAAGQVLTGEPAAALWLLSGLGAAATYWMLLGCTTPRYAALGSLLWAAHPGMQLAWGQSYWGGTLAFIGGAMVFGAGLRMQRRTETRDAIAMAAGALILALTRPYEGFVFCLATGAWVCWRWSQNGWPTGKAFLSKLLAPQAVILGAGIVALGAYNRTVTGDPLTFPYSVHEEQYGQTPMFVGGSTKSSPHYRHAEFDELHSKWELSFYQHQAAPRDWLMVKTATTWLGAEFFVTPIIAVAVLACRPWRRGRATPALAVGLVTYAATLAVIWFNPHYWAPFAPLLFVVAAEGLHAIDYYGRVRLNGLRLAPMLVTAQVLLFAVAAAKYGMAPQPGWAAQRAAISERLSQAPGQHLVLVKYGENHNCHAEWVYNGADIDGAKVVWARSMNPACDIELLDYFGDRQAWLVEPESQRMTPICRNQNEVDDSIAGVRQGHTPPRR
jgi:hypothetical protein